MRLSALGCVASLLAFCHCSKSTPSPTSASSSASGGGNVTAVGGTPTQEPAADAIAYSGSLPSATGYAIMRVANEDRRVYAYVPANRAARPPLIVVFHGTGANENDGALDAAVGELGVREIADAAGAIVVAPFSVAEAGVNADHDSGGPGWRFGDASSNADVQLTRALIQDARKKFTADATHVYAVGHSNGAFFTYFAAMKLGDRIAAFAESSGGLIACGMRVDCMWAKAGATSCADLMASAPAGCKCAIGAAPFPTSKFAGRVPQGFLKHNADDSTVSAAYTCRLGEHLGARAQVAIDAQGEHGPTGDFMSRAWTFLAARSLAD